jgi:hypothetical protein
MEPVRPGAEVFGERKARAVDYATHGPVRRPGVCGTDDIPLPLDIRRSEEYR